MDRILEQEIMDDGSQVYGWDTANREFSIYNFVYWFNFLKLSEGTVLDLGCGTAQHLIRMAEENPKLNFHGVDASEEMIRIANQHVNDKGLHGRIKLTCDRIENIESNDYVAVTSSGTLHHIPNSNDFWSNIKRFSQNNCPVLVMDIQRPYTEDELIHFMKSAQDQNKYYKIDLYNSFRAAYTKEEIFKQLDSNNIQFQHYEGVDPQRGRLIVILLNTNLDL